jgi:hypothetical protein
MDKMSSIKNIGFSVLIMLSSSVFANDSGRYGRDESQSYSACKIVKQHADETIARANLIIDYLRFDNHEEAARKRLAQKAVIAAAIKTKDECGKNTGPGVFAVLYASVASFIHSVFY